jgi:hypothetical protein
MGSSGGQFDGMCFGQVGYFRVNRPECACRSPKDWIVVLDVLPLEQTDQDVDLQEPARHVRYAFARMVTGWAGGLGRGTGVQPAN